MFKIDRSEMKMNGKILSLIGWSISISLTSCSPDTSIELYIGDGQYGKYQWTLSVEFSHPNDTLYSEQTEGFSAEVEIERFGIGSKRIRITKYIDHKVVGVLICNRVEVQTDFQGTGSIVYVGEDGQVFIYSVSPEISDSLLPGPFYGSFLDFPFDKHNGSPVVNLFKKME